MILIEPAIQGAMRRKLRQRMLAGFLLEAAEAVRLDGEVSVLLTTDGEIRRLNREFRYKDKATDVLSFPAAETPAGLPRLAGDLAISVETAARQADEAGHALATEIQVLMLHGLLHLKGYDHETDSGQMARREAVLRKRLGLREGLIERSGKAGRAANAIAGRGAGKGAGKGAGRKRGDGRR
jgi:probable rRNA maturation factor